jgi:drug/metabolite transporter (DMT)-like permease
MMLSWVRISNRTNSINSAKTTLVLILYCASGTLLTLVNKLAVMAFPFTNVLLVLQNGMAVVLLLLASQFCRRTFGSLPSLSLTILQLWIPLVLLFVMMLVSSLLALMYVSVPTVIVMRHLTALLVAILECVLLSKKINGFSSAALIFMLLGAILYAKHDLTFSIPGYTWLCVNIISTSVYQIYVKKIIHLPLFENVGSIGMSYYNNLISLPILFIFASIMGELKVFSSNFDVKYLLEIRTIGLLWFSGILGFSLSISAFALNKLISATSMMVANNANKFSIIVLSEIFVQSTLDITASVGALSVLLYGWLYSQTAKPLSKRLFFIAAIIFIVLSTISEYKHINIAKTHIDYRSPLDFNNTNTTILNKFMPGVNQIITAMKKTKGGEIYRSYLPISKPSEEPRRMPARILVKNRTELQLPKICVNRNASIWKICEAARCTPNIDKPNWDYPRTTFTGENTGEFINRVLEIAWGSNPPSVDLYLRSGCNGIMEMKYLFESIEIFWPRFLGSIIVVLDVGDEAILKYFLPVKPTHHYVIEFEYIPCIPGRVFNQYSYLNLDRYSSADYIVTVDSDCFFHSPVTPDFIFRQGKVILASSRTFQRHLWLKPLESMLGVGMYDGHYMVTQPITFSRSTFSSFRRWFYETKGKCYEDHLSQLSPDNYFYFCWMCQLGTYLERGNPGQVEYKKYWFQHLDNSTLEPILRYSLHVTYEAINTSHCVEPKCYESSTNELIKQGLCRAFGSAIFHFCTKYLHLNYINHVTFLYAHSEIQAADQNARTKAMLDYSKRLSGVTRITLY